MKDDSWTYTTAAFQHSRPKMVVSVLKMERLAVRLKSPNDLFVKDQTTRGSWLRKERTNREGRPRKTIFEGAFRSFRSYDHKKAIFYGDRRQRILQPAVGEFVYPRSASFPNIHKNRGIRSVDDVSRTRGNMALFEQLAPK